MIIILTVNLIVWIVYLFFGVAKSIKAQKAGDDWAIIDNNLNIVFVSQAMCLLTILTTASLILARIL